MANETNNHNIPTQPVTENIEQPAPAERPAPPYGTDDPLVINFMRSRVDVTKALVDATNEGREDVGFMESTLSTIDSAIATRRRFLESRRKQGDNNAPKE